ncbi:hypothetical protein NDU88_005673, partial [Pleurodeles waltl]
WFAGQTLQSLSHSSARNPAQAVCWSTSVRADSTLCCSSTGTQGATPSVHCSSKTSNPQLCQCQEPNRR